MLNSNIKAKYHGGSKITKQMYAGRVIWELDNIYLAQDSDFQWNESRNAWIYIGQELEVEIPHVINGQPVTSYNYMFAGGSYGGTAVTKVVSTNSNVVSARYMFLDNTSQSLQLDIDSSKITHATGMFAGCVVTSLDLTSLDVSNFTNTASMFMLSKSKSLNVSTWNTSKFQYTQEMFRESEFEILDLSSFDMANASTNWQMFDGAKATIGYARTQADANILNGTSDKPAGLNFIVK